MKFILFAFLTLPSAWTFARGGISGGGGGTTNSSPVTQERIAQAVRSGAGPVLSWMKGAQKRYFIDLEDKENIAGRKHVVLFAKLFSGKKSILDIFAEAKIEIRTKDACYDEGGQPWDGSVYSSVPGAICLSSFTMAPKLSERNVDAEVLALLVHELSHKLGADEEEAQAIQKDALDTFAGIRLSPFDSQFNIDNYEVQMIGMPIWVERTMKGPVKAALADPRKLHGPSIEALERVITDFLLTQSFGLGNNFSVITYPIMKKFNAHRVLVEVIQNGACLLDKGGRAAERKTCADKQRQLFKNDKTLTAREYLARENDLPASVFGPEYDFELKRISTYGDLRAALAVYLGALNQVELEVQAHAQAHYEVILN